MNPAIAALGRFFLTLSAAVGLASYINMDYQKSVSEVADATCQAAASECSNQDMVFVMDLVNERRQQHYSIALATFGIGSLSTWAAFEVLLAKARSQQQKRQSVEERLLVSLQNLEQSREVKQSLQKQLQLLRQRQLVSGVEELRQLEFSQTAQRHTAAKTEKASDHSSQVEHLQRQVELLQKFGRKSSALEIQLKSELEVSNQRIATSRQTIQQLQGGVEAMRQERDSAIRKNQALEQELQNARANLQSVNQLEQDLGATKSILKQLEQSISNSRATERQALEENSFLNAEKKTLEDAIADLKNQLAITVSSLPALPKVNSDTLD